MSFVYGKYFLLVIIFLTFWGIFNFRMFQKFSQWISDHWFYKVSVLSRFSLILQFLGVALICFAMLDLRGPEKMIQSQVSTQKTLILIDTSASMFVEDVRPNRFEKTLLLVKHFVKRSAGQKISIGVFSDYHKTIVPFTDDTDLIEARIDSLRDLNLNRGGTGLTLAIQEAIQKFKTTEGGGAGNILIFTDAEETDGGIDLKIPENLSVGIVGVGTRKGGPVPMRNSRGEFIRNKKFRGEIVISKLDEKFLEKIGEDIPYYKSWIATSYTLPTQEILNFFNRSYQLKLSKNNFRVRPVEAHKLLVPAMLFLIAGYLLKLFPSYVVTSLMLLLFLPLEHSYSQNPMLQIPQGSQEKKEPVKTEETLKLEEKFAEGNLSDEGVNYLSSKLIQDGFPKDGVALYSENLKRKIDENNVNHHFNYASGLLMEKGRLSEGIDRYKEVFSFVERNPRFAQLMQEGKLNILKALKQNQGGGGKSDDEDSEKQDKQQSSDQKDSEGKGKPKDQDPKDSDGKSDENDKKKQKKPESDMKRKDEGDKKESKDEKAARRKKLPALLKQLMSDDNKLQKKMIDTKTTKRKSSEQKDW